MPSQKPRGSLLRSRARARRWCSSNTCSRSTASRSATTRRSCRRTFLLFAKRWSGCGSSVGPSLEPFGPLTSTTNVFGFGGKKKKAAAEDPLRAYDAYLEDLDRQAGLVRKSAATLLAMRSTLKRDQ